MPLSPPVTRAPDNTLMVLPVSNPESRSRSRRHRSSVPEQVTVTLYGRGRTRRLGAISKHQRRGEQRQSQSMTMKEAVGA